MIEDDQKLCEAVSFQLEQHGFTVDVCNDGDDGLRWIRQQAHDLILLDRMLPTMNGISVLSRMRADGIRTPVLVMTALGTVGQRVEGLDAGADDYLVKPFAIEELMARIRSLSRRLTPASQDPRILICGDLRLSEEICELTGPAGNCTLSKRECALLEAFLRNPAQTLSRGQLLNKVWGMDNEVEDGNLDNYIFFLRRRLKSVSSSVTIQTVRGIGYRLKAPEN